MSGWAIVEKMMKKDAFSKWLQLEVVAIEEGYAKIKTTVREDQLNGFSIGHGGVCFGLADSAMAFAANSRGRIALTTNTYMSHLKSVKQEDVLTATTTELNLGERIAQYQIKIHNQEEVLVASFTGSVVRTDKVWEAEAE